MNKCKRLAVLLSVVSLAGLNSCGVDSKQKSDFSDSAFIEQKYVDFTDSKNPIFEQSDARGNGGVFGVTWSASNIYYSSSTGMTTKITKSDSGTYYGAEQRTAGDEGTFKYGYFGAYMQPSGVNGVCTTFFTYTGETEDNPHDEIDIEFLGKDTTHVQFNYFVNGVGDHEYMYDLGFDASKEVHQYGFKWTETEIVWYVDAKPVYGIEGTTPSSPQRMFQNMWIGNQSDSGTMKWMGSFNDDDLTAGVTALYTKVTYADLDGNGRTVANPDKVPDISEYQSIDLTFTGSSEYTVTNNANNTTDVTYTSILPKTYKNINAALPDGAKATSTFACQITNNNANDYAKVRIDMQMAEKFKYSNTTACNTKAWMDGNLVTTDISWGGSFFDVPASTTVQVVIEYYGIPVKVLSMIDSASRTDKDSFAGDVTFSNYKIGGVQEYDPVKAAEDEANQIPDAVEIEPEKEGNYLMDTTWTSDTIYTCSKESGKTTVSYSLPTNNYAALSMGNASSFSFQSLQYFDTTITNKNDREIAFCVQVKDDTNTLAVSGGALASGQGSYTRLGSNGAYFKISANSTAVLRTFVTSDNLPKIRLIPEIANKAETTGSVSVDKFVAYAGCVTGGSFID